MPDACRTTCVSGSPANGKSWRRVNSVVSGASAVKLGAREFPEPERAAALQVVPQAFVAEIRSTSRCPLAAAIGHRQRRDDGIVRLHVRVGPCGEASLVCARRRRSTAGRRIARSTPKPSFAASSRSGAEAGAVADAHLVRRAHGNVIQAVAIEVAARDCCGVLVRNARVDKRRDGIGERNADQPVRGAAQAGCRRARRHSSRARRAPPRRSTQDPVFHSGSP